MRDAILKIIDKQKTLLSKCEMLTEIGVCSDDDSVFELCEQIRNELDIKYKEVDYEAISSEKVERMGMPEQESDNIPIE